MTPTPVTMLHKLINLCPSFEEYWRNEENIIHREDDGSFTLQGLFSEFSYFVRPNFEAMPELARHELFDFVETCLIDPNRDSSTPLDNAVCTGLLENLAGERALSGELRRYLGPKSEAFFDFWN